MRSIIKPGILLGFGIGCMIMSTFEGILYAPDARDAIEEKKEELGVDKLPVGEFVKTVAPYYGPSAVLTAVGTGCILMSNNKIVNVASGEALMAFTADRAAREYRDKTKELVGTKKEKQIREALNADELARNPVGNNTVIITGRGDALCYDKTTGQYFKSNAESIKKVINILNDKMNRQDFVSMNEYCWALGLSPVKLGDERGWTRDKGLLDLRLSGDLASNGEPCIIVDIEQEVTNI